MNETASLPFGRLTPECEVVRQDMSTPFLIVTQVSKDFVAFIQQGHSCVQVRNDHQLPASIDVCRKQKIIHKSPRFTVCIDILEACICPIADCQHGRTAGPVIPP